MHKQLLAFVLLCSLPLMSQMAAKPAAKPVVKKPVTATAAAQPTAIIETTAGKLTCTLFPDKAPIRMANFIGLAPGTKDWTKRSTSRKMHRDPLYHGTIL